MESLAWTLLGYSALLLGFVGLVIASAAWKPAKRFCMDSLLNSLGVFANKLGRG